MHSAVLSAFPISYFVICSRGMYHVLQYEVVTCISSDLMDVVRGHLMRLILLPPNTPNVLLFLFCIDAFVVVGLLVLSLLFVVALPQIAE
jgi:hypothetical protein